jgi:site-specific DNA-cytosine methylase
VPQNLVDFSLSVVPQNRRREVGVGHASRSSGLLLVEASLARVSQFGLKSGGCATVGGARGTITEVASEAS